MKKYLVEIMVRNSLIYVFISILILYFTRKRGDTFKQFCLKFKSNIKILFFTTLVVVVLNFMCTQCISFMIGNQQKLQVLLLIKYTSSNLTMLYLVFITPIFEELVFRKILFYSINQQMISLNFSNKKSAYFAYFISTLIFALVHSIYPLLNGDYMKMILISLPYIVIGIGCSFVYKKTENIYSAIFLHIMNNLIGFLMI